MKRALTHWKKKEAVFAIKRSKLVYKGPELDIRVTPKQAKMARLLVIASRKSGGATERNLFKRRVRALFHENNLFLGEYDWIVFAKPGISKLSYAQLKTLFSHIVHLLSADRSSF